MDLEQKIYEYCINKYKMESRKTFLRGLYKICNDHIEKEKKPKLSKNEIAEIINNVFDSYDLAIKKLETNDDKEIQSLAAVLTEFSYKNMLMDSQAIKYKK